MRSSLRTTLRSAASIGRRQFSTAPSPREIELLQQVSRLETRVNELQSQLPSQISPAKITDWENLGFGIVPTNGHTRYVWSSVTNSWDAGRFISDPFVPLHIHAAVLHYGMTLFEGCKAFRCKDGKIRVCNLDENSARMNTGADRLVMPQVPTSMFNEAVDWAVRHRTRALRP